MKAGISTAMCGAVLFALFALFVLLSPGCSVIERNSCDGNPFLQSQGARPFVVGHGGSKRLFPENTMIAFDGVDSLAPDVLEMDVQSTADGVLITFHDMMLDRTTDGTGRVDEYTFEELKNFDFAFDFKGPKGDYPYRNTSTGPTRAEDVIAKYGRKYLFFIELKADEKSSPAAADSLASLLKQYGMEGRTAVSCFSHEVLERFREVSGGRVPTGMSGPTAKRFILLSKLGLSAFMNINDAMLQIPMERDGFRLAKKRLVNIAHGKGIAVYYWTINDEDNMRKLIEMGVDGIITDRPDIMNCVLDEAGY